MNNKGKSECPSPYSGGVATKSNESTTHFRELPEVRGAPEVCASDTHQPPSSTVRLVFLRLLSRHVGGWSVCEDSIPNDHMICVFRALTTLDSETCRIDELHQIPFEGPGPMYHLWSFLKRVCGAEQQKKTTTCALVPRNTLGQGWLAITLTRSSL